MSGFSLITFDCYGTLIDWESGMKRALSGLLMRRNLSLDVESLTERYIEIELGIEREGYRRYNEVLMLGVRRLFEERGIGLTPQEERIFADTIIAWPPFEETTEVLKRLKEKYRLAILSNIDDDIIRRSIDLMDVEFYAVITAEGVRSYKPSYGHWRRLIEVFNLPNEEILHVAASYVHDIVPAKELGFRTAWINRKNEKPRGDIRPDYEFRDLRPLVDLLG
ncbi:MAG TPA: haloacid dehalogenase type II [Thermodesulfobacteriota bacterium]|nr:haloacid dehalogenase type II [Thermodesulfobacteriota bacterium]